jgi:hypothetical protein
MFKLAVFLTACVAPAHGFGYFLNATDAPTFAPTRTPDWQVTGTIDISGMTMTQIWDNSVVFQASIADMLSSDAVSINADDVVITDVVAATRRRELAGRKLDEVGTYELVYIILNLNEADKNLMVTAMGDLTTEAVNSAFTAVLDDCAALEAQMAELGIEFDSSTCDAVTEVFESFECDDVADEDDIVSEPESGEYSDAPTIAPTMADTTGGTTGGGDEPVYSMSYSYTEPQWWTDLLA